MQGLHPDSSPSEIATLLTLVQGWYEAMVKGQQEDEGEEDLEEVSSYVWQRLRRSEGGDIYSKLKALLQQALGSNAAIGSVNPSDGGLAGGQAATVPPETPYSFHHLALEASLRLDRRVLSVLFTPHASGVYPLRGAPLVKMVGDALQGTVARLEKLSVYKTWGAL
jgi:hypothetical protein